MDKLSHGHKKEYYSAIKSNRMHFRNIKLSKGRNIHFMEYSRTGKKKKKIHGVRKHCRPWGMNRKQLGSGMRELSGLTESVHIIIGLHVDNVKMDGTVQLRAL